jgi:hypothetical protein
VVWRIACGFYKVVFSGHVLYWDAGARSNDGTIRDC